MKPKCDLGFTLRKSSKINGHFKQATKGHDHKIVRARETYQNIVPLKF